MEPEKWAQIKELFGEALERAPNDRAEFLEQACRGDETLRQELESLLESHEGTHSTLPTEHLLPALCDVPDSDAREDMTGRRIGPYQIMRGIGQGGMATVYLAARADDQYRKRVAIKLVKRGIGTEEILHRFRHERQTLAALDHPNIVKLLDGGSTEEGDPYLVMEYVEGVPIDEYCDSGRLNITERLQLFRAVCAALQYAHQNLVIHRDLKPGNILVTSDGLPKVLDFGIAKLLNPECSAQSLLVTRASVRLMTPQYASPEQIRGQAITTATDIYSLGVVFYELLTGHRPYRLRSHTPLEIERAICEQEPEKPSTIVTRVESVQCAEGNGEATLTPETVSLTREGRPDRLRRRLSGDLDNIVLMALRKEPPRRYASVEQFSADIRRHLEGLPVKARPSTVRYRCVKFLKRHNEAALAALTALLLTGAVAEWQFHQGKVRPISPGQQLDTGVPQPRRSVAVWGFKDLSGRQQTAWLSIALSEMLTTELGVGEKVRTVPGELIAKAKRDLSLPDTEALAPATLAKVRGNLNTDLVLLGSYVELASGQIRLDLRLQDTTTGETIAETAETGTEASLFDLVSRTGTTLREKLGSGPLTPAEALMVKASLPSRPEAARLYAEGLAKLRASDALGALDPLEKASAADAGHPLIHRALSEAWGSLGYDDRARAEARNAFDLSASLPKEEQHWVEAQYYATNAQWDKAVEVYGALFQAFPDNTEYGLQLTVSQIHAGKGRGALITLETLRRLPSPAGDDPRIDLEEALAADTLGDFQHERSSGARAEEKARNHGARFLVARALVSRGVALWRLGQSNEATKAYDEAIRIYRELHDQDGAAEALANNAGLVYQHGNLSIAKGMYEEALGVFREIGNKRQAARILSNIAVILFSDGDLRGARKDFEQSLELSKQAGDKGSVESVLGNIAEIMLDEGDVVGATNRYREVRAMAVEAGDEDEVAYALQGLGNAFKIEDDLVASGKQYAEALKIRKKIGEKANAAQTQLALAELSLEQGMLSQSESLAREAKEEFEKEQMNDDVISASAVLARSLLAQGKASDAQKETGQTGPLLANSQSRGTRLEFAIADARIHAAAGDATEARRRLAATLLEAQKCGFLTYQFEARLALGEIEMKSGKVGAGRTRLTKLEAAARSAGFGLIARKAAAAN